MPIVKITWKKHIDASFLLTLIEALTQELVKITRLPKEELSVIVTEAHSFSQQAEDFYIEIITIPKREQDFSGQVIKNLALKLSSRIRVKVFIWVFFNPGPHS